MPLLGWVLGVWCSELLRGGVYLRGGRSRSMEERGQNPEINTTPEFHITARTVRNYSFYHINHRKKPPFVRLTIFYNLDDHPSLRGQFLYSSVWGRQPVFPVEK